MLFHEPPAAIPTAGVIFFIAALALAGAWFWLAVAMIALALLAIGALGRSV